MSGWRGTLFWLQQPGETLWHVDDATIDTRYVMCGQAYDPEDVTVRGGKKPKGKHCPQCEKVLLQAMLRYGIPEVWQQQRMRKQT